MPATTHPTRDPQPPIRDARMNKAGTRIVCGWRDDRGNWCPGVLADWLTADDPATGESVSDVRLPEGFTFASEIGAYRLSNGARARGGENTIARDRATGATHIANQERYEQDQPLRRLREDRLLQNAAEKDVIIVETGAEWRAALAGMVGTPEDRAALGVDNPGDMTKVREHPTLPFDIICRQCDRMNRVRLDIGHTAG